MNDPLSADTIYFALGQFFAKPIVSSTHFFKMRAENITVHLEGNFGSIVLPRMGRAA